MFDSYKHFLETPGYHKIIGEDYLIVEFKCPIKEELFDAWSECHSIVYVLNGQKKWITPNNEYLVTEDQSIFVRKGAFKNQQYFEESFCVLMFFMKDVITPYSIHYTKLYEKRLTWNRSCSN